MDRACGGNLATYAYKSSSSSAAAVGAAPPREGPSGHWMFRDPSPPVEFLYTGSNFFLNWSNFARSLPATERRAPAKASSKCFRPISLAASVSIASSPALSSSAAIASRIAAFAARWHSSAKSAPLKPSVFCAMKDRGTFGAVGGSDEENVLLHAHAVDLREQLVHHPVASAAGVAATGPSCRADRVKLVEEEHTRRCG